VLIQEDPVVLALMVFQVLQEITHHFHLLRVIQVEGVQVVQVVVAAVALVVPAEILHLLQLQVGLEDVAALVVQFLFQDRQ
jgi:hypothetical protein